MRGLTPMRKTKEDTMRFEFDTAQLTRTEIAAAILFLTKLQDDHEKVQATVTYNGASGTPVPSPSPAEATGVSLATTGEATESVEAFPASVKPARVRRTKAQIEADNLAADAAARAAAGGNEPVALSQEQQDAVDDTAGILTTEQKAAIAGAIAGEADAQLTLSLEQVTKIIDLDALRSALQGYTAKRDLAAGIALLGTFECKRISDVLALDADKQQAFILACHV